MSEWESAGAYPELGAGENDPGTADEHQLGFDAETEAEAG